MPPAKRGVQRSFHGDSRSTLRLQAKGLLERGVQPLGAWALGQTLDAMSLYLRLGFELDLFSPCEFQMYATQGSNPRRADRVPGRSATHTCEPYLGQDLLVPRLHPKP